MTDIVRLEHVEFPQVFLVENNLKPQHLFIIDYLAQFFSSGNAKYKTENKKDKYYLITLNKIIQDLPFLSIKKRRLQELIHDLEAAQLILRYPCPKNSPKIYLKLNLKITL